MIRRTRRLVAATILVGSIAACSSGAGVRTGDAGPAHTTEASAPDSSVLTTPTDTRPAATPAPVPTTTSDHQTAGDGLGDQPFPELGNPGIDVTHYDVDLRWAPATATLTATVRIDLTLTETRTSFTLDATEALDIADVALDGAPVTWTHDAPELRVTPGVPLGEGTEHRVTVEYSTTPGDFTGAGGLSAGWLVTDQGSYTLNEPDLARTWMPCDDHPSDKATWEFAITVPDGTTAVANGRFVRTEDTSTLDTWVWSMDEPMSTYLVQVVTGNYDVVAVDSPPGVPDVSSVVLRGKRDLVQPSIDGILPMIAWFEDFFGPYPFESYGIVAADSMPGLAMEQQTRSLFPWGIFSSPDAAERELFLSHELAHQWFGDAVSPASWQDVWLNESFATYAQWMWADHLGQATLDDQARNALFGTRRSSPAEPGANLFGYEVYDGGATVLHALRRTVGDATFFEILRTWASDNFGTSRTTADFIAHAETVAGRSLTDFFATWLYTARPPSAYP